MERIGLFFGMESEERFANKNLVILAIQQKNHKQMESLFKRKTFPELR